jgi:hypothetical protein
VAQCSLGSVLEPDVHNCYYHHHLLRLLLLLAVAAGSRRGPVVGDHMPPNKQVQSSSKFQLPFAGSNNMLLKVGPWVFVTTAAAAACQLSHPQLMSMSLSAVLVTASICCMVDNSHGPPASILCQRTRCSGKHTRMQGQEVPLRLLCCHCISLLGKHTAQ